MHNTLLHDFWDSKSTRFLLASLSWDHTCFVTLEPPYKESAALKLPYGETPWRQRELKLPSRMSLCGLGAGHAREDDVKISPAHPAPTPICLQPPERPCAPSMPNRAKEIIIVWGWVVIQQSIPNGEPESPRGLASYSR